MTAKSIVASTVPEGHTFDTNHVHAIAQTVIDSDRNRRYQTKALLMVVIGSNEEMAKLQPIFAPPLMIQGNGETEVVWDYSIENLEAAKTCLKMLKGLGTVQAHLILKGLANAETLKRAA